MTNEFRSIAVWPDTIRVGNVEGVNESSDTHRTYEEAEGVCRLLRKHGFGGKGEVFPLSTRIESTEPDAEGVHWAIMGNEWGLPEFLDGTPAICPQPKTPAEALQQWRRMTGRITKSPTVRRTTKAEDVAIIQGLRIGGVFLRDLCRDEELWEVSNLPGSGMYAALSSRGWFGHLETPETTVGPYPLLEEALSALKSASK